jgi:acetylornithine deacetylase
MTVDVFERGILQKIRREDAISLLRDLVRIPSPNPPGDTRAIAHFLAERMERDGLCFELVGPDEKNVSVLVKIKGTGGGKSLVLNGHIDTVPIGDRKEWTMDPLEPKIENGRIYGRGSTDCKSGITAMIMAAEALKEAHVSVRGDITLAMVAGEETLSQNGTGFLLKDGFIEANAGVVTEPTTLPMEHQGVQPLQIYVASRGMAWLEIEVKGKAVHARMAPQGVNAIEKMARIILALQNMTFHPHIEHPLCGAPTLNVGMVNGGMSPNIVPDYCRIVLDRNIVPGENASDVIEKIKGVITELEKQDKDLKASIKILLSEEPVEISRDEEITRVLRQVIADGIGGEPILGGTIGANDSRLLVRHGIPSVICGPGITTQGHTIDEYAEIDAIVSAAKAYALLMARLCS